jgi:hypothetical protein
MTPADGEQGTMDSGVKVVGAQAGDDEPSSLPSPAPGGQRRAPAGRPPRPRSVVALAVVAALGVAGTLVFGILWAGGGGGSSQDPAVLSASRAFLTDLTNFNAKTVDADFSAITAMATGTFSKQAKQFFDSAIRVDLEKALAESRGQIRNLYVQSDSGTQATVYGVIDQVYVNNKISTPQADVLRVVVNLQQVGTTWMISDVTTLEGATPGSATSPSGSAGSAVPGQ